jgi:hypothetical protein
MAMYWVKKGSVMIDGKIYPKGSEIPWDKVPKEVQEELLKENSVADHPSGISSKKIVDVKPKVEVKK